MCSAKQREKYGDPDGTHHNSASETRQFSLHLQLTGPTQSTVDKRMFPAAFILDANGYTVFGREKGDEMVKNYPI